MHCAGSQGTTVVHRWLNKRTVTLRNSKVRIGSSGIATHRHALLFPRRRRAHDIWVSAPAGNHKFTKGISWPASQPNCFAIGAVIPGKDVVTLDRHAKVELLVPARATSSSNAIACGAAMILREAIEKSGYHWKSDGPNMAQAMMTLFQKTGKRVDDPPGTQTYSRLDLQAALAHVMKK